MAVTKYHVFRIKIDTGDREDTTIETWDLVRANVEAHSPKAAIRIVTEELAASSEDVEADGTYSAPPASAWKPEPKVKIDRKPRALFA